MAGYVKAHRKMLNSVVMSDDWLCRLFMACLLKANYRTGWFKGEEIPPGSFATSVRMFAEYLGVSKDRVQRGFAMLQKHNIIEITPRHDFSVVTLCNWETYQSDNGDLCDTDNDTNKDAGKDTDKDANKDGYKKERREEGEEDIALSDESEQSPDSPEVIEAEIVNPDEQKLDELIDAFNDLCERHTGPGEKKSRIAPKVTHRRGKAVRQGWKRVQKEPELRECFEDVPALIAAIEENEFMHGKGWFRFPWLFATGKDGEWNAVKILQRSYLERGSPESRADQNKRVVMNAARGVLQEMRKHNAQFENQNDVCGVVGHDPIRGRQLRLAAE